MAEESLQELAEQPISARRIRRQVEAMGRVRVAEREHQVESLKTMTFEDRRSGSSAVEAPELAVVMMDGGRYQRRDRFGQETVPEENTRHKHWRESKVGCLLSMQSDVHANDPYPRIPDCFMHASAVREIAKVAEKQGPQEAFPNAAIETVRACRYPHFDSCYRGCDITSIH